MLPEIATRSAIFQPHANRGSADRFTKIGERKWIWYGLLDHRIRYRHRAHPWAIRSLTYTSPSGGLMTLGTFERISPSGIFSSIWRIMRARFSHLVYAHLVACEDVAFGRNRYVEIESVIDRIWIILAQSRGAR